MHPKGNLHLHFVEKCARITFVQRPSGAEKIAVSVQIQGLKDSTMTPELWRN